jgi:predicted metal-dependent phosphoesterase TrpH
MGLADLHIHTLHSWDGTSTVAAILKQVLENTHLNVIAITDHDCLTGALEALELAPSYGIDVIPGCEITTAQGHLLAYFIKKPVPAGLSLVETALKVGEMGGICVAAHPCARMTNSLHPRVIRQALHVGIEVYNAGLVHQRSNVKSQILADSLPIAQVGNSDAHLLWVIGRGMTYFPGNSALELRRALENHATKAIAGPACKTVGMMGHWLTRYLLRCAGLVAWNAGPQAPIRFGRPVTLKAPSLLVNSNHIT